MRKGFSHKVVFEQRPQGCTVWRKGIPSGGNKCKCLQASALGCGISLQATEAQFADGLGNGKKKMSFIATLKNREGASGIRRKKNDIFKWRSGAGTEYDSIEFPKLSGCHW